MTNRTKWIVGGLVVAGVVGVAYLAMAKPAALASGATPTPLPGSPKAPGQNVTSLTLSPGTMSTVPLTAASSDALSLFAPAGASLGSVTVSQSGQVLVSPTTATNYEYVANAAGTATITVNYTDASGALQTSTIPVTVT